MKSVDRLATRAIEKPMNQQSLKPIIESAPYTVFTMARLYLFPKDLMIYYDGNPIDQIYYVSMYLAAVLYGIMVLYFWKKNRPVAGLLIILVILLAPTYSPVKVAWYLSERYLYYGTGFFAAMLAMLIISVSKKTHWPAVAMIVVSCLTVLYSIRAVIRNAEFQNTHTLALATIRTSPHSIRGYDDLGGDYLLKGNYRDALPLFRKTLTILPDSNTAISNLGYIYILYGIPQTANDLTEKQSAQEMLRLGSEYYKQARYTNSFYYLYQSSMLEPKNPDPKIIMADIYMKTDQFEKAENMYLEVLKLKQGNVKVFNKLAFAAFRQNKYDRALLFLREALKYEPSNQNVKDNIKLIEQTKLQGGIR
jgi:cytochrome c-type biogenesis protein CcmH/NrfG